MTRHSQHLVFQAVVAMAVCVAIAILDRPLIGLIAFAVCVLIFVIHAHFRAERKRRSADIAVGLVVTPTPPEVGEGATQVSGCYNPDNSVLPIYYPTERH